MLKFLIFLVLGFLLANGIMIYKAIKSQSVLTSKDYYQKSEVYEDVIKGRERSRDLGMHTELYLLGKEIRLKAFVDSVEKVLPLLTISKKDSLSNILKNNSGSENSIGQFNNTKSSEALDSSRYFPFESCCIQWTHPSDPNKDQRMCASEKSSKNSEFIFPSTHLPLSSGNWQIEISCILSSQQYIQNHTLYLEDLNRPQSFEF